MSLETSDSGFYWRKHTVNVDGNSEKANQRHLEKIETKKTSPTSLATAHKSPKPVKGLKPDQFITLKNQKHKNQSERQKVYLDSIPPIEENTQSFLQSTYFHTIQSEVYKGGTASSIRGPDPYFGVINFFLQFLAVVFLILAIILVYAAIYGVTTPGLSLIIASYLLIISLLFFIIT